MSDNRGSVGLDPSTSGDEQQAFLSDKRKGIALEDFEIGAIRTVHAYQRWLTGCMDAAGLSDLTVMDTLALLYVNHRGHDTRLADICFLLNIEDTHTVAYSLRKLSAIGVVEACKHGKEVTYTATPPGRAYLARFNAIRDERLLAPLKETDLGESALEELARFLRKMSGLYDQAARAASSL
jgi:predicted MarR family transcription regulator